MKRPIISLPQTRGFSLVELMVALTIFSIVMMIGVGTLLVLIDANAKAQAISSAMTNLTFAIDSMTRNIRTGKNYYCTSANDSALTSGLLPASIRNCTSGNTAIVFTPGIATSTRVAYRYYDSRVEQRIDSGTTRGSWVPITSDVPPVAVNVNTLSFVVEDAQGASSGNYDQPYVQLVIAGSVENGLSTPTPFQVQSRVTQRILNY